jgi:amino acid transporter
MQSGEPNCYWQGNTYYCDVNLLFDISIIAIFLSFIVFAITVEILNSKSGEHKPVNLIFKVMPILAFLLFLGMIGLLIFSFFYTIPVGYPQDIYDWG